MPYFFSKIFFKKKFRLPLRVWGEVKVNLPVPTLKSCDREVEVKC